MLIVKLKISLSETRGSLVCPLQSAGVVWKPHHFSLIHLEVDQQVWSFLAKCLRACRVVFFDYNSRQVMILVVRWHISKT